MPSRKKGPGSLSEWIVGRSINSTLGPIPRKSNTKVKRDVVRVTISTDDEAEEDSLRITYPRTGSSVTPKKKVQSVVKKVRFEDSPRKSALKKTKVTTIESGGETSDTSNGTICVQCSSNCNTNDDSTSEVQSSDASTGLKNGNVKDPESTDADTSDTCPMCSGAINTTNDETTDTSGTDTKVVPKSKQQQKPSSPVSTNTTESKPTPTPKKLRRKLKKKLPESDSSDSEAEPLPKIKRKGRKKKQVESESETETETDTTDSAKESEGEDVQLIKKIKSDKKTKAKSLKKGKKAEKLRKGESKSQKKARKEKQSEEESEDEDDSSTDSSSEEETPKVEEKRKKGKKKQKVKSAKPAQKPSDSNARRSSPQSFPGTNLRGPHLIEPIRAEVVQTERVVESPEDPPPNAYYDPQLNVMRLYHGPVYGKSQGQGLYPKRDPANNPLPMGVPHPTENPYFQGFMNPNQFQGYSHVPITQGMPPPAHWAGMGPGYYGFPPPGVPVQGAWNLPGDKDDKDAAVVPPEGPPSSKDKDKAGLNNVVPEEMAKTGENNPYYPPKQSIFSSYGKRSVSDKSRKSGSRAASGRSNNGLDFGNNNDDNGFNWNTNNDTADTNPIDWNATNTNNDWGSTGGRQPSYERPPSIPSANNNSPRRDHWDKACSQTSPLNFNGSDQGSLKSVLRKSSNSKKGESVLDDNNVMPGMMPGTWVETTPSVPAWGDPTVAVDTGGASINW